MPASTNMRLYLPLIALALAMPRAAAAAQTSEVRVFLGYENQRADLVPSTLSTLNGLAVSVERLVPPSAGSLVLDVRSGLRSAAFIGGCELLVGPCANTVHASNFQFLLLSGLRTSLGTHRVRMFADALGGLGYEGTSSSGSALPVGGNDGWSPAVELGTGADAAIRRHVDARVRASWLFTDFNDDQWHAWRHHMGLSAGVVLRP